MSGFDLNVYGVTESKDVLVKAEDVQEIIFRLTEQIKDFQTANNKQEARIKELESALLDACAADTKAEACEIAERALNLEGGR